MSKTFHAENRETGERWVPDNDIGRKQYLVLYDNGYLAIVTEEFYTHIKPLNPNKWKVMHYKVKDG